MNTKNIISVDRSIRPSYPNWVETVMYPEMESNGPAEYDISAMEQWLHEKQKSGEGVKGHAIYAYFKSSGMLKTCVGLRDLEEIQKKGSVFFQEHFKDKWVFGWSGLVLDCKYLLFAPYLCDDDGKVVLCWSYIITAGAPAERRFASQVALRFEAL